jgi:hypothetical protein
MRDLVRHFEDLIGILVDEIPGADLAREPAVLERDDFLGSLSLAVSYPDRSVLFVELTADCSGNVPNWTDYGFHYLGPASTGVRRIRFRYDNAPHYPALSNSPHHLHVGHRPDPLPVGPPTAREVAAAIRWYLDHPASSGSQRRTAALVAKGRRALTNRPTRECCEHHGFFCSAIMARTD